MLFLDVNELFPGMRLARDIHYYDTSKRKMIELKKGTDLTSEHIRGFKASNINGVYVDYIPDDLETVSNIDDGLKDDAVAALRTLADNFLNTPESIQALHIQSLSKISSMLVESLSQDKSALVNIFNLKKHDEYTYHHSVSVAVIAVAIGMELGFDEKTLRDLALSGMLHDIGKVTIPVEIINKPARLTNREFDVIKTHPINAGVHLVKRNFVNENTFKGIVFHHERWDGTGYPNGLDGDKIPLFARIITVADVYDALTSNRPYRTPMQPSEAIEYIMGGCGSIFDVDIVKVFLKKIAPYPAGKKVRLSDGRIATVVKNNPEHPLRPVVKINGTSEIIDLLKDRNAMNITIKEVI